MRSSNHLLLLFLLAACNSAAPAPAAGDAAGDAVRSWGPMREVLRDGQTQARVDLAQVLGPHTIAVGALAGLAGELTVLDGTAHVAEVVQTGSDLSLRVRTAAAGEQATLLVLADVPNWTQHTLPGIASLTELEDSLRELALASGMDVTQPFPFRLEGRASGLGLHVLNHSCPIADPEGPAPWRFTGSNEEVTLVGFYAEDSGGVLTHHGQRSHVHALLSAREISGHLDQVTLAPGARLFLPRQ